MPVRPFASCRRLSPPYTGGDAISASCSVRGSGLRLIQAAAVAVTASALTLGLVATRARAQEQLIIYGIGAQRCSAWTQSRGTPGERRANLTWMQGYMTAAAIHGPDETSITRATDREILETVDTYCREHPRLRVLGYRLRQLKLAVPAVWTFEQVLVMREEDPQGRRDLALALADAGETQRAIELMWEVIARPWGDRFRDVNLIVVGEMNALIAAAKAKPDTSKIDARLIENLPVDIRVVLIWDTPNSDMDLHVIDPRGEECYYGHQRTAIGGRISEDITTGYGPEEFLLRKAIPGTYAVRAKFFGTGQQTAVGATTVVLELYLRYGTGQVENRSITLRLDGPGRMVEVGTFTFEVRGK